MSTVLRKDLKMSPFKHVKKQQLSAQVVDKLLQRCKILLSRIQDGTFPNLVFSGEKKCDIKYHFNTQNYWVWSRNGDEGSRVVARNYWPSSVRVWAAETDSGRSLHFFIDQEVKLNQQNYWDDIHPFWCIVALGTRALQKPSLVFSSRLCTITWGQRDLEVAFRECFGNCLSKPYSTQIHLLKFTILFHFIVITTLSCNDKYWWLCRSRYQTKSRSNSIG